MSDRKYTSREFTLALHEIPDSVKDNLLYLISKINECGVDGGEATSSAIDDLENYKQKLENIKL